MQVDNVEIETMTVKEAEQVLGRSRPWIEAQARAGKLGVTRWGKKGRGHSTLYIRADVFRLRDSLFGQSEATATAH